MVKKPVVNDERSVAVVNASYGLAYGVMTFGLLLCMIVRGFVAHEGCGDLMALVIISGGVAALYRRVKRVQPAFAPLWLWVLLIASLVAFAIGLLFPALHIATARFYWT